MIFLDTSFIVSYKIENDENHEKAVELMQEIITGKYGKPAISDYIFDETVTVIFNKSKKLSISINIGDELKDSAAIIKIDDAIFEEAWILFKNQKETKFSFTDCTILSVMKRGVIKNIATFDRDFKSIKEINVIGR